MEKYNLTQTGAEVQEILNTAIPQSELTEEVERAQGAEQTLQDNIDAEELRAKAAEQQNADDIDAIENIIPNDASSNNKLVTESDLNSEVGDLEQADTVLQGNIEAEELRAKAAEKQNADDIDVIEEKIPTEASGSNQLADKAFVNSSIASNTATYRGSFNQVNDLHLTLEATEADIATALASAIDDADNNDYCYIQVPVSESAPTEIAQVDRYKFNGTTWAYEYTLNNSGFTADQWAALNSAITSGLVAKLSALPNMAELTALLAGKQNLLNFDTAPTTGSSNPVTSGGVKIAIDDEKTRAQAAEQTNNLLITQINGKIPSDATSENKLVDKAYVDAVDATMQSAIEGILALIPEAATALNQLADKAFVNSSIATNTGTFKGTYNVVLDLELFYDATHAQIALMLASKITSAKNNDYCYVQVPNSNEDPTSINHTDRYKYNGTAWAYEYTLNNSGFSAAQWAAINSGITELLKDKLVDLPTATELAALLNAKQNTLTFDTAPTPNSTNPVTSDGIHAAINVEKERAEAAEEELDTNKADKATTLAGYGITDAYTKNEVNNMITTPNQQYVTVATYASLPASGSKDTIYRVSSYDGANSQVDDTVYSEYAWDGTQYVFLCVKSQIEEVFDITVYNSNTKYADLAAALGVDGANIPATLRRGGMSVKFVQSSDNKYVQFRCMSDSFTTDITQWQGVDDVPTAGSKNLVESGGVVLMLGYNKSDFNENGYYNYDGASPRFYESESYKSIVIPVIAGDKFVVSITATRNWGLTDNSHSTLSHSTFAVGNNIVEVNTNGYLYLTIKIDEEISVYRKNTAKDIVELNQKTITDPVPTANSTHLISSGAVDANNNVRVLNWNTDAATTRCQVPLASRKGGMILVYKKGDNYIAEEFNHETRLTNIYWGDDGYWRTIAFTSDVNDVKNKVMQILATDLTNKATNIVWNENAYINKAGEIVSSTGACYSNPIDVVAGDIIYVTADGMLSSSRSLVNKVTGEGTEQNPYVYESILGYNVNHGSYAYIAPETMKIAVVSNKGVAFTPKVYQYNSFVAEYVKNNLDRITPLENKSKVYDIYLQDSEARVVTTEEAGNYIVRYSDGATVDSSAYRTTKGIWFDAGNIIRLKAFAGGTASLISKTDDFGKNAYFVPKKQYVGSSSDIAYTLYQVIESGYYVFSYRASDGISVEKYTDGTINTNALNIDKISQKKPNLVKSVSHQGTPFSGNNRMSRLYHSIIQGFDYNLVNLSFTSDNVPVLNHDGEYINTNNETVVISEHTWAEIEAMPVKGTGEILGKFDDCMKMCKLMGTKVVVMGFTHYFSSTQQQAAFNIVAKYQMRDNTIWGVDTENVANIMSWYSRAKIMLIPTTQDTLANLLTTIQDYAQYKNEKNKIILWLNGSVWSVSDIASAAESLPEDMEIGMYFIGDSTDAFLNYLPYITYYTHDYYTIQDKQDAVISMAKDCVKFAEA